MSRLKLGFAVSLIAVFTVSCGGATPTPTPSPVPPTDTPTPEPLTHVTLMLDWTPNTNHTGLYVAQANGYFADEGLEVEFIQPSGDVPVEQVVGSGEAEFGISFQEWLTFNRAEGVPIVSIAAIIQHNTSAFASLAELGIERPRDMEGHTYGAFGVSFERPLLQLLMECDGGDIDELEFVDVGFVDALPLLESRRVDIAWIFEAWDGIRAQVAGVELNFIRLSDWTECVPDYYTPVLITSEQMIEERPEIVRAFVHAAARGYEFAIENPQEAADILLEAAPELDPELVRASQDWLSPRYQADASQWGRQDLVVWRRYTDFLVDGGALDEPIDVEAAFTNEFLP